MDTLQIVWFFLIVSFFAIYAILDGFDLGVGFWHLFARREDRPNLFYLVGPLWDGNEVWFLAFGGAMFAAFPQVYATLFSGFYLLVMIVIFAFMFRGIAIDFRNKSASKAWQGVWDIVFAVASITIPLIVGIAVGNLLYGLKIDSNMNYFGTFSDLLNPYALLVGLLALLMCATHGASYIVMKTGGALQERAVSWSFKACGFYMAIFFILCIATIFTLPHLFRNYTSHPFLFLLPIITLLSMLAIIIFNTGGNDVKSFVASIFSVAGTMATLGIALFPVLVYARNNADLSLTIMNSSASPYALKTLLIVVILGMPLVIAYQIWVYRKFAGKVT